MVKGWSASEGKLVSVNVRADIVRIQRFGQVCRLDIAVDDPHQVVLVLVTVEVIVEILVIPFVHACSPFTFVSSLLSLTGVVNP